MHVAGRWPFDVDFPIGQVVWETSPEILSKTLYITAVVVLVPWSPTTAVVVEFW